MTRNSCNKSDRGQNRSHYGRAEPSFAGIVVIFIFGAIFGAAICVIIAHTLR